MRNRIITHRDEDGRWYLTTGFCSTMEKSEARRYTLDEAQAVVADLKSDGRWYSLAIVEASSPLGLVVGALLRAHGELENDAISESYGVHPPLDGALRHVAASHGWTLRGIEEELERRGVSARWMHFSGLDHTLVTLDPDTDSLDCDLGCVEFHIAGCPNAGLPSLRR